MGRVGDDGEQYRDGRNWWTRHYRQEQLAAIVTATSLLGGAAAGLLGRNVQGAMTAAQNETLNNACVEGHDCGKVLTAIGAAIGGAIGAPLTRTIVVILTAPCLEMTLQRSPQRLDRSRAENYE
ncbi:hypothetical protein [Burkholderia cepacia]|uniref:hypothetical protein n=1 Tax=Burkholderia cepacia TaxID=292 RepID=UPI001E4FBD92|nr:hypothetical protein [Burkholderia cepacia]